MKKEINRLSIKSNLLIFSFCILLIPIAITTTIYTFHARSKLIHQQLNKLTAIAESKRLHAVSFMNHKIGRTIDSAPTNSYETVYCLRRCNNF